MMTEVKHLEAEELEAGLEDILQSPKDHGAVKMIARRPDVDHREVLEEAKLDITEGLVGDNWRRRGSGSTPDGSAHPEMQLNIMNARVIALVAVSRERWSLAGDQFFIDLDLTKDNLPPGSQLELGTAIVEIPSVPHLGCKKFATRFGVEAAKFVNSRRGKQLNLRGINARLIKPGVVRVGDTARKLS
jgi:hypothetical protein